MIEWGKRETGAAAALLGVATVGGIGWWVLQQRQAATSDWKPVFSDGTPARTAGPDGTLEVPSQENAESESRRPPPAVTEALGTDTIGPSAPAAGKIVVFVSGAVKRPGVYTFKPDARLYHAVRAAGGFKANAQTDALNLADLLRDADQIYIPPRSKGAVRSSATVVSGAAPISRRTAPRLHPEMFTGGQRVSSAPPSVTIRPLPLGTSFTAATPRERGRVLGSPPAASVATARTDDAAHTVAGPSETMASVESGANAASSVDTEAEKPQRPGGTAGDKFKNPGDGVVNINTAGLEELQRLPGVGPSTAQKFLDYRTQIGRFASVEQVQDVKGIGPKRYEKLRPFIVVR
ncbi:MAG: helix-hairpin-helix domain-containing protein [Cytophagales bacterium]|nr:helix-hairpin-helix domain-containing protein [Armatimonadota bacterium]